MRERRQSLGLSLLALARRAGVAPSHIFHVENGQKVPSESVVARLARELGEEQDLYRWWVRARSRSDLATTIRAAGVLQAHLTDRGPGRSAHPEPARGAARLLVPLLVSLSDLPADPAVRPARFTMLRLDPAHVIAIERLERPFAFHAGPEAMERVRDRIGPGAVVVITRRFLPLDPDAIHLVRLGPATVLARTLWNGRDLLLLPAAGRSDFVLIPARSESDLARHILGAVAAIPPHA